MAKISITTGGSVTTLLQADDFDRVKDHLCKNGYSRDVATSIALWAQRARAGSEYKLSGAKICILRGNVEVYDRAVNEWVEAPAEMEAFLADIDDVCRKHGLSLTPDSDGDIIPFRVQEYTENNMSLIWGAYKDYKVPANLRDRLKEDDFTVPEDDLQAALGCANAYCLEEYNRTLRDQAIFLLSEQ